MYSFVFGFICTMLALSQVNTDDYSDGPIRTEEDQKIVDQISNWIVEINQNRNNFRIWNGVYRNSEKTFTEIKPKKPSLEKAYKYARFAGAAYCQSDVLMSWSCPWCIQNYEIYNISEVTPTNSRVFIAKSKAFKEIIIALQGSSSESTSVADQSSSFVALKSGPSGIYVHQGLNIRAKEILPFIKENLKHLTEVYDDYKFIFVGHSIGGAIASLLQFYLEVDKFSPATHFEIYSYGAPRVGNKRFADFMNNQGIIIGRVVNMADVSSHLPFGGKVFPVSSKDDSSSNRFDYFYHHSTEIWLKIDNGNNDDGMSALGKICSTEHYEAPECSDSVSPNYKVVEHLVYYDVDMTRCQKSDASKILSQIVAIGNISSTEGTDHTKSSEENAFGGGSEETDGDEGIESNEFSTGSFEGGSSEEDNEAYSSIEYGPSQAQPKLPMRVGYPRTKVVDAVFDMTEKAMDNFFSLFGKFFGG